MENQEKKGRRRGPDSTYEKRKKRHQQQRMLQIFQMILIVPSLLWLVVCLISLAVPGVKETLDYDLGENRKLASFPSEFSGQWFGDVEKYYNDHAPFRSLLVSANSQLSYMLEAPYTGGIRNQLVAWFHPNSMVEETTAPTTTVDINALFGTTAAPTESASQPVVDVTQPSESEALTSPENSDVAESTVSTEDPTEAPTEAPTEPREYPSAPTEAVDVGYYAPFISNNFTIVGRQNWLYLAGDNINYYVGDNLPSDAELQNYADTLGRLQQVLAAKGKKLAIVVVPCKPQVYPEYMPTFEIVNTYKRAARIVDYVSQNTSVPIAYPLQELQAMKDYYLTYKKYDGHWNAAGSFIGYQVMLRLLGKPMTNPLDVVADMAPVGSGGGDLINPGKLNMAQFQNDFDYTFHYKDNVPLLSYEGEMFKDDIIYHMVSGSENPEKLAIIGDSFRNHMVLYAYRDFCDSTLIHYSRLGQDTWADQMLQGADTITMMFVERNDRRLLTTAEYLLSLLG